MAKSEEFKRELKAGNFTQALQLALTEAIELKITTWVSSDQDLAQGAEPRVGHRMRTRINIVDGDIDNEIGSQFLSSGPYAELQQFHLGQVAQGRQIVHQNLQSLRELFSVLIGGIRGQLSPADPPTPLESGMGQIGPASYPNKFPEGYVNYDSVPATIDTVAQTSPLTRPVEPLPSNLIDLDLDETTLTAPGPDETATVNEFGDMGAFGDQGFEDLGTAAQPSPGSGLTVSDLGFSDAGFDPNFVAQPPEQFTPDFEAEFDPNLPAIAPPVAPSPAITSPGFDTFGSDMADDPFALPDTSLFPSREGAEPQPIAPDFAGAEAAFADLDFNPSFDQDVSRSIDQPNPIQPDNFFEDLEIPAVDSPGVVLGESQNQPQPSRSDSFQTAQAEPELTPWELEDSETLTMSPESLTNQPGLQRSTGTPQPIGESELEDELSSFFGDQLLDDEPTLIASPSPPAQPSKPQTSSQQARPQEFADLEAAFDLGPDGFDPNELSFDSSGPENFTAEDFGSGIEAEPLGGRSELDLEEFTRESPTTELLPRSPGTPTSAGSQPPIASVEDAVAALFGESSLLASSQSSPRQGSDELLGFDEDSLNALFGESEVLDEAYLFPSVPDVPGDAGQGRPANQNPAEGVGGFADFPDEETTF